MDGSGLAYGNRVKMRIVLRSTGSRKGIHIDGVHLQGAKSKCLKNWRSIVNPLW